MHKRILLIVISLFCINTLLSVISSCTRDDDPWGQGGGAHCATLRCLRVDSSWISLHNISSGSEFDPIYKIKATDLRIDVNFKGTNEICRTNRTRRQPTASLFNTAYALTPPICPLMHGRDSIVAYHIFSDKDYDSGHPAGSSLNDIFVAGNVPQDLVDSETINAITTCTFTLNALPVDSGRHVFTVNIVQLDGDTLTLQTPTIHLKKP